MMFRLIRFLIITMTLGRIKWLMRLTWVWRFIVFLGVTGWLSKRIRRAIGLDASKAKSEVDSAWAEALRYAPKPATAAAGVAYTAPAAPESPVAPTSSEPVSESISEVTGFTADGTSETITIHEVRAEGETETIVRIADDAGNVETVVTGSSVEDIDLAHLGTQADALESTIEEIVEAEIEDEIAIDEILDTLEAAEPEVEVVDIVAVEDSEVEVAEVGDIEAVAIEPAKPKRSRKPAVAAEAPASPIDPDWVRADGSHECPASHPVKAKASSMIYYAPESGHYDRTIPDVCFASDADALAAGYRAPRR